MPLRTTREIGWGRALVGAVALFALLAAGSARAQGGVDCPRARILGMGDTDEVHWTLTDKLRPAGREQIKVVRDAFQLAPPLLCLAVRRVAFVHDTAKSSVSGRNKVNDRQDLLYLNSAAPEFDEQILAHNERARVEAMHTVLHEATHAAQRLLYTQSKASPPAWLEWRPDAELWTGQAQALAKRTVRDMRLDRGVFQEWERLHGTFQRRGLADGYYGKGWTGVLAQAPGFASAYGGEDVAEDMAEIAGWALVANRFASAAAGEAYPTQNQACFAMRKEPGPGIPANLAAVFTKVGFAQSIGFISEAAYADCVGRLKIRGQGNGFFSFENGQEKRRYTQNLAGRIGQLGDSWSFELSARGNIDIEDKGSKAADIRLTLAIAPGEDALEMVSFPRGLYHIGPGERAFNTLQITYNDDGEEKLAMEVWEADVLIARASHQLVEGAVFVKQLINHTELFKLPQPPKQPRLITFRKEGDGAN